MALSLDTDFRSLTSSLSGDAPPRRSSANGETESFSDTLERVRETGSEQDGSQLVFNETLAAAPPPIAPGSELPTFPANMSDIPPILPAAPTTGFGGVPLLEVEAEVELDTEGSSARPVAQAQTAETAVLVPAAMTGVPDAGAVITVPSAPQPPPPPQKSMPLAEDTLSAPAGLDAQAAPKAELAGLAVAASTNILKSIGTEERVPPVKGAPTPQAVTGMVPTRSEPIGAALVTVDEVQAKITTIGNAPAAEKLIDPQTSNQGTTASTTIAAGAAPAPSFGPAAQPAAAPMPLVPAHAVMIASPAEVVGIISKTADDGQSDRVVVQLDPPELGRVSIDFKFDAQGLQHVTITSETPEAMRQLRQMHSELVQALERHGIGSQNMSFQHQQHSAQQTPSEAAIARQAASAALATASLIDVSQTSNQRLTARTLPGGRLDIRM